MFVCFIFLILTDWINFIDIVAVAQLNSAGKCWNWLKTKRKSQMGTHGLHSNWWLETLISNLENVSFEPHDEFVKKKKVVTDLLDFWRDNLAINWNVIWWLRVAMSFSIAQENGHEMLAV